MLSRVQDYTNAGHAFGLDETRFHIYSNITTLSPSAASAAGDQVSGCHKCSTHRNVTESPRCRIELSDKNIIAFEQRSLGSEDMIWNDDGTRGKIRRERSCEAATNDNIAKPRRVNSRKIHSAIYHASAWDRSPNSACLEPRRCNDRKRLDIERFHRYFVPLPTSSSPSAKNEPS